MIFVNKMIWLEIHENIGSRNLVKTIFCMTCREMIDVNLSHSFFIYVRYWRYFHVSYQPSSAFVFGYFYKHSKLTRATNQCWSSPQKTDTWQLTRFVPNTKHKLKNMYIQPTNWKLKHDPCSPAINHKPGLRRIAIPV